MKNRMINWGKKYPNCLIKQANDLLYRFEIERFQNCSRYSRQINLVLEFDEYLHNLSDTDIMDILESEDCEEAKLFRQMINEGIDGWLDDYRIKTLCLR